MLAFGRDLKHAFRQLRDRPAFMALAVMSLGIGIGAPTIVFTAVNTTLLRGLPVRAPQQLVEGYLTDSDGTGFHAFSYPDARELAARTRSLSGLAAYDADLMSIGTGGEPRLGLGELVTGNYFRVVGATPALGRFFAPDEDGPATARAAAVVSDAFWRSRLGADPAAVGRTITVNGVPFTVIGVTDARFSQASAIIKPDIWTTMGTVPRILPNMGISRWAFSTFQLVGRLRPGVSRAAAQSELSTIQRALDAEHPEAGTGHGVQLFQLTTIPAEARGALVPLLSLLMAFAGLITLVACGNVASMLLARGLERRREMAIRSALGASRARIVGQITLETMLLFLGGAAAGVGLSYLASMAFARFHAPVGVPLKFDLPIDWRVVAFAVVVALFVGAISGLLPGLRSTRSDVAEVLKSESTRAGGRSRARSALVVGQVAFTFVLLVGAGLVVRALTRALKLDPGFRHADVHVAVTDIEMARLDAGAAIRTAYAWSDAVAATPGVQHVALTTKPPLAAGSSTSPFSTLPVAAASGTKWNEADWAAVSPSYFDALAIPLVAGRAFESSDDSTSQRVAVVSLALAQRYFGGAGAALGYRIWVGSKPNDQLLIVGVARDTKIRSPVEPPRAMLYQPLAQTTARRMTMLVVSDREDIGRVVRDALHRTNPALPIVTLLSYDEYIGIALIPQRLSAIFAMVLGIAGLILASIGVFGIVAYAVTQRRHEIGVRLAIGATPSNVVATIARSGLQLLAAGIGIGLVLAMLATRAMGSFLLGVSPFDGVTFGIVVLGVAAIGFAASALPARRAARVDPVIALRAE